MRLFSPAEMLQTNLAEISVEQRRRGGGGGVMAWRRLGWPAAGAGAEDGQPALSLRAPPTQCAPVQLFTCMSAISHGVHLCYNNGKQMLFAMRIFWFTDDVRCKKGNI
jgi:hypothetical protein